MLIGNKELIITPAEFEDAIDLRDAVEDAVRKANINIDLSGLDTESAKAVLNDEKKENTDEKFSIPAGSITSLISTLLSVDSSKNVRRCLFKCAERALFDKVKVNQDFFENTNNRKYYYPIMFEVLKVNLTPFFEGLFSMFKGLGLAQMMKNFLK